MQGDRSLAPLWRSGARFAAGAALIWLLLAALWNGLPYLRNGAAAVAADKRALAAGTALFSPVDRQRIVVFGDSRLLAGFEPAAFAAAAGPGVSSFNLAIPGEDRFVDILEAGLAAGNRPTHVMLQKLPAAPPPGGWRAALRDDRRSVEWLLPFRPLPRDAATFLWEALRGDGLRAHYRANAAQIAAMRADRGHFFIRSQSHYPGDRLPPGFSLPTDRPGEIEQRSVDLAAPDLRRLMGLAEAHGFEVVLVPTPVRLGEKAQPPDCDSAMLAALRGQARLRVLGPASLNYPPTLFSDPVHLNREGARRYSQELAALWRADSAGR